MEVAKHTDEASNKDWRRVGREAGRLGLGLFFFFCIVALLFVFHLHWRIWVFICFWFSSSSV